MAGYHKSNEENKQVILSQSHYENSVAIFYKINSHKRVEKKEDIYKKYDVTSGFFKNYE